MTANQETSLTEMDTQHRAATSKINRKPKTRVNRLDAWISGIVSRNFSDQEKHYLVFQHQTADTNSEDIH